MRMIYSKKMHDTIFGFCAAVPVESVTVWRQWRINLQGQVAFWLGITQLGVITAPDDKKCNSGKIVIEWNGNVLLIASGPLPGIWHIGAVVLRWSSPCPWGTREHCLMIRSQVIPGAPTWELYGLRYWIIYLCIPFSIIISECLAVMFLSPSFHALHATWHPSTHGRVSCVWKHLPKGRGRWASALRVWW